MGDLVEILIYQIYCILFMSEIRNIEQLEIILLIWLLVI